MLFHRPVQKCKPQAACQRRRHFDGPHCPNVDLVKAEYVAMRLAEKNGLSVAPIRLDEVYGRLVYNILCGNTDDHARNHAAFRDGEQLSLTPGYDICGQGRTGNVASQSMLIVGANRASTLADCIEVAAHTLLILFPITRVTGRFLSLC